MDKLLKNFHFEQHWTHTFFWNVGNDNMEVIKMTRKKTKLENSQQQNNSTSICKSQ